MPRLTQRQGEALQLLARGPLRRDGRGFWRAGWDAKLVETVTIRSLVRRSMVALSGGGCEVHDGPIPVFRHREHDTATITQAGRDALPATEA